MRTLLVAGSAMIAACAVPIAISAQTTSTDAMVAVDGRTYVLTAEQKTMFDSWSESQRATYLGWPYDAQVYYWSLPSNTVPQWWSLTDPQRLTLLGWPVEARTAYFGWPSEVQTYYWGLPGPQQVSFWSLTPEQQATLYTMTSQQQAAVWASADRGATPAVPAIPGMPGDGATRAVPAIPAEVSGPARPGQATIIDNTIPAPPPSAMNKTYPVCTKKMQDSCRNPGGK